MMKTSHLDRQTACFFGGILALVVLAAILRFSFADWDGGYQLHPDERAILYVAEDIAAGHPNPFRTPEGQLRAYPYGHLPLYLEVGGQWLLGHVHFPCAEDSFCGRLTNSAQADPFTHLTYVGRALSALYDTLTVMATILLSCQLMDGEKKYIFPLLAGGTITLAVLHIQNAHFGTADTALTLFCTLGLVAIVRYASTPCWQASVMAGTWIGMAIGSKATGALMIVPLMLTHLEKSPGIHLNRNLAFSIMAMLAAFFITNPFALLDPIPFARALATQVAVMHGWVDWPFTRQYIGTMPLIYVIEQQARWTLGWPFVLVSLTGTVWAGWNARKTKNRQWAIIVVWIICGLMIVGTQLVKFPRYMLPFTPTLAVCTAGWVASRRRVLQGTLSIGILVLTAAYALAFLNMYREPHPWVAASEWICETIPSNTIIAVEYWDDPLPLPLCEQDFISIVIDPFAEPDDDEKLANLMASLEEADYIILSSSRLYGTIPRLSELYPLTGDYYRALFAEEMSFEFERAFFRYPNLGGISLVDNPFQRANLTPPPIDQPEHAINMGFADESFTVYDHPLVLVFRRRTIR